MTVAEEQPAAKRPVDVKQAVRAAMAYVRSLYEGEDIYDMLLEEVEYHDECWYITVGFTRRSTYIPSNAASLRRLAETLEPPTKREYKIVQVDETTGKPLSMKIRKLETHDELG